MTINFLDVIKQLMPSGKLFKVKPGGHLDNVLSGVAEYVKEDLLGDADKLRHVRNPELTTQLNDLERDYGLINDSNLSEEDRRRHLNVFAYSKNGNGDRLFLQTRLRNAGFETVNVIENSPPIDPNLFLQSGSSVYCGDGENAFCGDPDAIIGELESGELLIDGIHIYDVPSDQRQNFVFFVGGAVSGWVLIEDWDMEAHDLLAWAAGPYTFLDKDTTVSASGLRSLLVQDDNSTHEQEPFPLSADPSLVSAYRMFDLDAALGRQFSSNLNQLIVDWDMESGTSDWSISGTPAISKTTSVYATPLQSLLVNMSSDDDYVYQDVLTVGRTYCVNVYYKSGGQVSCQLMNGDTVVEERSVSSGDFESLVFEFTAIDSKVGFSASETTAFYIDSFICYEKPDSTILYNGDFEGGLLGWTISGDPDVADIIDFDGSGSNPYVVSRDKSLSITSTLGGVSQDCLVPGNSYRILCFLYGETGASYDTYPIIKNGDSYTVYNALNDPSFVYGEWNIVTVDFIAVAESLGLSAGTDATESFPNAYFDSIIVYRTYDHAVQNIAPRQLINDGSCESPTTNSWFSRNNPTLTKETAIGKGVYCLQVAYNGTNDASAWQNVKLEHGSTYRVSGYGRGSTSSGFSISINGGTYTYALSSTYNFSFEFTCTDSSNDELVLTCLTNSAGGYAQFDDIYIVEIDPVSEIFPLRVDRQNHLYDGYCDDPLTTHWSGTNCNLIKDSANKLYGDYGLGIYPTAPGAITCENDGGCVVGKKYRLSGYLSAGDSNVAYQIRNGSTFLWVSTVTTGWQSFDVVFTATDTDINVYFSAADTGDFCFIDHLYLKEIQPQNQLCENNVDYIGRHLYVDHPNYVDAHFNDMIGLDDRWCVSADVKIPPSDEMFLIMSIWDQLYISRNDTDASPGDDYLSVIGGSVLASGNDSVIATYDISDNEWHNVIVDYDVSRSAGTTVRIWIDGNQIAQGDITIPTFSFDLFFGNDNLIVGSTVNDSDGNIQNVMIYNCAKTDEEKLQIYRNFLDVFWGGYERRIEQSGTSNITQYLTIGDKVIPSELHLLPKNLSGNSWFSGDRDSKELLYVGVYSWRTTSTSELLTITLQGVSGSSVSVDWGDGNIDDVSFSGVGFDDSVTNTYSASGYKTIDIYGAIGDIRILEYNDDTNVIASVDSFYKFEGLTKIDLSGSLISVGDTGCPWGNGIEIVLTSCELSGSEIDRLLNRLYTDGITDGTLHLNGTNGDRTSASDTAYSWLIANGWTIFNATYINNVDTDDIITSTQEDVIINGHGFLSTQSTGKVEICDNQDYDLATVVVEQSDIDSWSTDVIQFDVIQGALLD